MSFTDDFRAGQTQYEVTSSASSILYFEILAVSIYALVYFQSWYGLVGSLIGLSIGIRIQVISHIISAVFIGFWGYAGYYIGFTMISKGNSIETGIALALLGLFFGFNVHSNALVWVKDISR